MRQHSMRSGALASVYAQPFVYCAPTWLRCYGGLLNNQKRTHDTLICIARESLRRARRR